MLFTVNGWKIYDENPLTYILSTSSATPSPYEWNGSKHATESIHMKHDRQCISLKVRNCFYECTHYFIDKSIREG